MTLRSSSVVKDVNTGCCRSCMWLASMATAFWPRVPVEDDDVASPAPACLPEVFPVPDDATTCDFLLLLGAFAGEFPSLAFLLFLLSTMRFSLLKLLVLFTITSPFQRTKPLFPERNNRRWILNRSRRVGAVPAARWAFKLFTRKRPSFHAPLMPSSTSRGIASLRPSLLGHSKGG